jgi:hypothetical protein
MQIFSSLSSSFGSDAKETRHFAYFVAIVYTSHSHTTIDPADGWWSNAYIGLDTDERTTQLGGATLPHSNNDRLLGTTSVVIVMRYLESI